MDVYFYRLGIFFQSIFDVNSQVTWNTNYVGHETGNIYYHSNTKLVWYSDPTLLGLMSISLSTIKGHIYFKIIGTKLF